MYTVDDLEQDLKEERLMKQDIHYALYKLVKANQTEDYIYNTLIDLGYVISLIEVKDLIKNTVV